jgi:hypothetical protein
LGDYEVLTLNELELFDTVIDPRGEVSAEFQEHMQVASINPKLNAGTIVEGYECPLVAFT